MIDTTGSQQSKKRSKADHRIKRLFSFASLLKCGEYNNAREIAKRFNVSKRTIFRDLQTLKSAGVILRYDAKRDRYQVDDSVFPYHLLPNPEDLAELLFQANVSAYPLTTERSRRVKRATNTLLRLLPENIQGFHSKKMGGIRRVKSIDDDRRDEIMNNVLEAIRIRKCLDIEVLSEKLSSKSPWKFQPGGICYDEGTFLLFGVLVSNDLSLKVSIDKIISATVSDLKNDGPAIKENLILSNPDIIVR